MPPRDIQLPAAIKQGHAVPVRSEQIIRVVFFGVLFDERIDNKNNILIYGITMWHRRSSERWEVYPF